MARTREQWVARWRASGLSGKTFAEQHGLRPSTLYEWGRKCAAATTDGAESAFAEVRVTDQHRVRRPDGRLEIVAKSGRVVVVHGDVDVEQLVQVLEAVERC